MLQIRLIKRHGLGQLHREFIVWDSAGRQLFEDMIHVDEVEVEVVDPALRAHRVVANAGVSSLRPTEWLGFW